MTTSRTTTASRPVAAWTSRPPAPSAPIAATTTNHVANDATTPAPAPAAIGRRVHAVGVVQPGGDRGEDEDALEPLAEDEHGTVDDDGAAAEVLGLGRVRRAAAGGDDLPDEQATRTMAAAATATRPVEGVRVAAARERRALGRTGRGASSGRPRDGWTGAVLGDPNIAARVGRRPLVVRRTAGPEPDRPGPALRSSCPAGGARRGRRTGRAGGRPSRRRRGGRCGR